MESQEETTIKPIQTTRLPRTLSKDDWWLHDMTIDSSRIALCCYSEKTNTGSIDLFTLNDLGSPSLLQQPAIYTKEFPADQTSHPYVSFTSDSSVIVVVRGTQLELYNIQTDDRVKHSALDDSDVAECVTVRERDIFIGVSSKKVIVFDLTLNKVKTIYLNETEHGGVPVDIAVCKDHLFICTAGRSRRAVKCNMEGSVEHEYKNQDPNLNVSGISVSTKLSLVFVSCDHSEAVAIVVYSLSEDHALFTCHVAADSYFLKIGLNDVNRVFTVAMVGEVREYSKTSLFTFSHLKEELSSRLNRDDWDNLRSYFSLPPGQVSTITGSQSYSENTLLLLEERGYIHPSNVDRLSDAFADLSLQHAYLVTQTFKNLGAQENEYGRFLASLATHLTLEIQEKLCAYFQFTEENMKSVFSNKSPALSFLLTLDDMGKIHPADVSNLRTPLEEYHLLQAVAKIDEYQSFIADDEFKRQKELSIEDKEKLFIKCLRQKMKSWFETRTPVPWKKSCRWKSDDLFISSGLVLTTSDSKISKRDVDPKSKIHYRDIFTHDRLRGESRIILEGQPGSGKTMLSSQLAYDWCCGKIQDIPIVIFLPLKIVENMTIVRAIKLFYIRKGISCTESDIEYILVNGNNKVYLILDGLEEYNGRNKTGEPSEVMCVMQRRKLPNCTVLITARTDFAKDLPPGPMLKLGSFGEEERNEYIEKVYSDDLKRQEEVKEVIDNVPFIMDLCSVPLLFVLSVHNINSLGMLQEGQLDRVTPFVNSIIDILCPLQEKMDARSYFTHQEDGSFDYQQNKMSLEELAFNGLCRGNQQLEWQKVFVDRYVTNSKTWIDAGILVVEEGIPASSPSEDAQDDLHRERFPADSLSTDDASGKDVEEATQSGAMSPVEQTEIKTKVEPKEKVTSHSQRGSAARDVSLQVKFLHKLIQEWYAARFLAVLFCVHSPSDHGLLLVNIDPTDLHFVLRFTCYNFPPSFDFITSFLVRNFKTEHGQIPGYIISYICLCFAEYDGDRGQEVKDIAKEVCGNDSFTISSDDSRLLLRAKVSMLNFASVSKVPIKLLKLTDVLESATDKFLLLKSGVRLGVLDTLQAIEVSRWDHKLKAHDYEDLINFLASSGSIETACLLFASPPAVVKNEKTLADLQSRNVSVEWIIGAKLIHTLDVASGEWAMDFRLKGASSYSPAAIKALPDLHHLTSLRTEAMVDQEGGYLEIPNSGVLLEIPAKALNESYRIEMRIIPHCFQEGNYHTFASNSSVVIELLPENIKLLHPVRLTLPHCLRLKKTGQRKAIVYSSHHAKGTKPNWKAQHDTLYQLNESNCTIKLESFSWETYEVDDTIVEYKKINVYAACSQQLSDNLKHIEVGYYLDLPGEKEIIATNNLQVLQEKPFLFLKEGRLPLTILLEEVIPMSWKCNERDKHQKIPFTTVELSVEFSCPFVFKKIADDECVCYFKAAQTNEMKLVVPIKSSEKPLAGGTNLTKHNTVDKKSSSTEALTADSTVNDEFLRVLSGKFSKEWLTVGRDLGLKDPELQNIEADYRHHGQREVAYKMLSSWKEQNGRNATYRVLGKALGSAGRKDLEDDILEQIMLRVPPYGDVRAVQA